MPKNDETFFDKIRLKSATTQALILKADAWRRPETYEKAFEAWDILESETFDQAHPTFFSKDIFDSHTFQNTRKRKFYRPFSETRAGCLERCFTVDKFGIVVQASSLAMEIFGIEKGAQAGDVTVYPASNTVSQWEPDHFIDLIDLNGFPWLALMTKAPGEEDVIQLTICRATLIDAVRDYLVKNLHLTTAELEVLTLIMQRFSIAKIATYRDTSVNTARKQIANIIGKFNCHSLTETLSRVYELNQFVGATQYISPKVLWRTSGSLGHSSMVDLGNDLGFIEHHRNNYGGSEALVLLHSMEYGIEPPKSFVAAAIARGYRLYIPYRPGFGRSTPTKTVEQSAELLRHYLKAIGETNVTLVAFSTATPIALRLLNRCENVGRVIAVNFSMKETGKLDSVKPRWVRGLLKLGVGSGASFRYAMGLVRNMIKVLGYEHFYRSLYSGQIEDLEFLDQNPKIFQACAERLVKADNNVLRADLLSSFLLMPDTAALHGMGEKIAVIYGEHPHGLPVEEAEKITVGLGLETCIIPGTGRNCVYADPDKFFAFLEYWRKSHASNKSHMHQIIG